MVCYLVYFKNRVLIKEMRIVNLTALVVCREDVEVWECFSSPEILVLKAQCELVRYRGAAPSRLQCQFGLTGPIFEVVPRHLCRRCDQLSVLQSS